MAKNQTPKYDPQSVLTTPSIPRGIATPRQMAQPTQKRITRIMLDEMPRVSQKLKLACARCGRRHTYDVGAIFHAQEGEGESAKRHYTFTNYFRCLDCGSAGPWDIADFFKVLALVLRARVDSGYRGFF